MALKAKYLVKWNINKVETELIIEFFYFFLTQQLALIYLTIDEQLTLKYSNDFDFFRGTFTKEM